MINVKKLLSSLLAIAMISSFATVMAEKAGKADYVVTYQAEEITDMDVLLDMAVEQNVNKVEMRGSSLTAEVATDDLCVEQLLEVREYSDGHFEEDKISTVFSNIILRNTPAISETGEESDSFSSVSVTQQISYTHSWTVGNESVIYVKTNKAVVAFKNSTDIVKMRSWYEWQWDGIVTDPAEGKHYDSNFLTTNANTGTWYTKTYNKSFTTAPSINGGGVAVGMQFTVNGKEAFETVIGCNKD